MLSPEEHRKLASSLYNKTWELMEVDGRTPEQDDALLSTAHASAYHWQQVGNVQNFAVSHWQLARVYALLMRPRSALYHGQRSLALSQAGNLTAFYHAYAHEAIARGHMVAGERDEMLQQKALAQALVSGIEDAEERSLIEPDLASLA